MAGSTTLVASRLDCSDAACALATARGAAGMTRRVGVGAPRRRTVCSAELGRCLVVAAPGLVVACGPTTRRLDEVALYRGPRYQPKLVRYFEHLPLSMRGAIAYVQCASARTRDRAAGRVNDAGWVEVAYVNAIDSGSAAELASQARTKYLTIDDGVLVITDRVLRVSFDDCASFRFWDPRELPVEWIRQAALPGVCVPRGPVTCRPLNVDFDGEREPVYSEVRAGSAGEVSFMVRSEAFQPPVLRVCSEDFGRHWTVRGAAVSPSCPSVASGAVPLTARPENAAAEVKP